MNFPKKTCISQKNTLYLQKKTLNLPKKENLRSNFKYLEGGRGNIFHLGCQVNKYIVQYSTQYSTKVHKYIHST